MDILLLLLELIGIAIWLAILAPALILVSKFLFFFSNGKQMEASMTPGHRQWKKSILTGGALCAAWWPFPPFIWNSNTSLGLNLFILIWTTPLGLNVTSAIPPFIYSVGPGNHFMLLDPDVFFALFLLQGILDLISVATPSCFA